MQHPEGRSSFCQAPAVLWMTGLSGAGKTTLSTMLVEALRQEGLSVLMLDGDALRSGLCKDLGFGEADRRENMRRAAELARLLIDAGQHVVVSLISPFAAEREAARRIVGADRFFEVHVHAPLPVVQARDPKGLYARARRGEVRLLTGVDSPYEPPVAPLLRIDTSTCTPSAALEQLLAAIGR